MCKEETNADGITNHTKALKPCSYLPPSPLFLANVGPPIWNLYKNSKQPSWSSNGEKCDIFSL